jgi:hypothetical protein
MYVRKDVNLRPRFPKILQSFYNSSIQKIDFDQSAQAVQAVNSWVSEITNGRIKAMFSAGKHLAPALQKRAKMHFNPTYTFTNVFFAILHNLLILICISYKRKPTAAKRFTFRVITVISPYIAYNNDDNRFTAVRVLCVNYYNHCHGNTVKDLRPDGLRD